jgi:hypothetical protein
MGVNRRSILLGAAAAAGGLACGAARHLDHRRECAASESVSFAFTTELGAPTVVHVPPSEVRYYANDSTFPYLPNSQGTANITFWVNGVNYRSTGQSLDTMGPINPTTPVLKDTGNDFDNNGAWLFAAQRPHNASGTIFGFYHAEDHVFGDGGLGKQWNTTGLATSDDDGVTWVKKGQILGSPHPTSPPLEDARRTR